MKKLALIALATTAISINAFAELSVGALAEASIAISYDKPMSMEVLPNLSIVPLNKVAGGGLEATVDFAVNMSSAHIGTPKGYDLYFKTQQQLFHESDTSTVAKPSIYGYITKVGNQTVNYDLDDLGDNWTLVNGNTDFKTSNAMGSHKNNLTMKLEVPASAVEKMPSGKYSGTVTFMVKPI